MILKDKKILLGVSSSISIYKAIELLRLFQKAGAKVKVVMSKNATNFIKPIIFEALSTNEVLYEKNENWSKEISHIGFSSWADAFVIAPATANTINKIACGISDNLLVQCAIAFNLKKPFLIAPAANTKMFDHFSTQNSLKILKQNGFVIIQPQVKQLACKDVGNGALRDIEEIFYITARELLKQDFWINKNVLITGGKTSENIDIARCISNFSSGKMAYNLAKVFFLKGANVVFLKHEDVKCEKIGFRQFNFQSSNDLYLLLQKHLIDANYLFQVAAISDYVPKNASKDKLKKEKLGKSWKLCLVQNDDLLLKTKSLRKDVITIAFKAESDENMAKTNAINLLNTKDVNAVCLNLVSKFNFGSQENQIYFITNEKIKKTKIADKFDIANQICDFTKELT